MRIVTTGARHRIARFLLARTLCERFELARGPQVRRVRIHQQVVVDVVAEVGTRTVFIKMLASALDRGVPFEVTLHANLVAPVSRELCRIDNRSAIQVSGAGPVTTLAGDP